MDHHSANRARFFFLSGILLTLPGIAQPACRDCGDPGLGPPAENRYTAFDTLCASDACREQGVPQVFVNTANLNLVVRIVDLKFGGADTFFAIERTWNLDDAGSGAFGTRWSSNVTESLSIATDQTVTLRRAGGHIDRFAPGAAPNAFFAVTAATDTLARAGDGTYTLAGPPFTSCKVFDATGRLVALGEGTATRVAFEYDTAGKLAVVRYRSRAIRVTWNAAGQIASLADAAGRTVNFAYTADGNLAQQSTADGQVVSYQYDGAGNLTGISSGAGTAAFGYRSDAPYVSAASVTMADGAARQYDIPHTPREIRVTGGAGDATLYASNAMGLVESITDVAGNRTVYLYDGAGRRTRATAATGDTAKFDYDTAGNLVQVTDPAGKAWAASYDGAGRRIRAQDPNGNAWLFGFDADGMLSGSINPAGVIVSLVRSATTATFTDGAGNRTAYQYDADGFLVKSTDAAGAARAWVYDNAGRVTSRTDPGGTIRAAYDARNRVTLAAAASSTATFSDAGIQRDVLGRMVGYTDSFGNRLGYAYDASGRLAGLVLPGDKNVTYEYDSAGRLAKVSDWAGNFAVYSFDAAGWPAGLSVSGGPVTVYQYDAAHNLKALVGTGPDGNPLVGYRYTLDSSGNRVVVSAMEASTAPLKLSQGRIGYDALGRPAAREDGTKFRYDARGNLVGIDGPSPAALTWDDFGRLTGFSTDSSTVSRYDALGLRAERTAGGATRRFVYDVSGAAPRVMMETDDAGSPVAYYVYGLGLLWKVTADGQTYFYHFDGDGNVVALSSPAAGVVNRYRYDALGRLAASDETVENAFRARGASGWVDDGNGLIYTGAGFWYPELRLTLPATLDLSPTAPKSLPVLTGGGACLMQGLTECSLGTARRMP